MAHSNHLDETKSHHKYTETVDQFGTRSRSYAPAEYEHQEYPKETPYGIAKDAAHEAQMKANAEADEKAKAEKAE